MRIVDFDKSHVESAMLIAKANYYEERGAVPFLPETEATPYLQYFAGNGLGVAALEAFFTYGFGLRCMDAIRPMEEIACKPCEGICFDELTKKNAGQIRELRKQLSGHLGCSPCFLYSTEQEVRTWIEQAETRDSRLFVAKEDDKLIAFIEVTDDGENFATEDETMRNICGAYCLPEYRGRDIAPNLLNYAIGKLAGEGYKLLGVDFESFNPTAYGFWLKHFTAYTKSVGRRIDECALRIYE